MSGVVLLNPLFVFSTKSSPRPSVLLAIQTSIKSLQTLSYCRLFGDLSIFYRYCHGRSSLEIRIIIPDPVKRIRTTRTSTHSHPFQVSLPNPRTVLYPINPRSFQEPVKHGTSYLLPLSLSRTTRLFLNLTLTNFILILSLLNLSFTSFAGEFGYRPFPNITLRPLIVVPPTPKFDKNYHPFPFINTLPIYFFWENCQPPLFNKPPYY